MVVFYLLVVLWGGVITASAFWPLGVLPALIAGWLGGAIFALVAAAMIYFGPQDQWQQHPRPLPPTSSGSAD